ncbi:hypothetical protein D3C84_1046710 [compost metagenome]
MAEFAEQFFQLAQRRQQAGRGGLAELGTLAFDKACAGDMPADIAVGAAQVDQDQLWRIQAWQQVRGFDHQGQAGKVSHPRSPVWKEGRL